ncbi:unnamed protein product [Phytophthora fragariaefolia]|uniref:Unnamed protein product n=1 Tax=Phytophthora fragariaefolia TaxID=1490495 RepID=A0A9W6XLN9_9STRA|nr:unnamed protein product [Phytophthora fragariaefolia]
MYPNSSSARSNLLEQLHWSDPTFNDLFKSICAQFPPLKTDADPFRFLRPRDDGGGDASERDARGGAPAAAPDPAGCSGELRPADGGAVAAARHERVLQHQEDGLGQAGGAQPAQAGWAAAGVFQTGGRAGADRCGCGAAAEEAYKQQMIELSQKDKFDLNGFYDHLKVGAWGRCGACCCGAQSGWRSMIPGVSTMVELAAGWALVWTRSGADGGDGCCCRVTDCCPADEGVHGDPRVDGGMQAMMGVRCGVPMLIGVDCVAPMLQPEYRENPRLINGKVKRKISEKAGHSPEEINNMLRNYEQLSALHIWLVKRVERGLNIPETLDETTEMVRQDPTGFPAKKFRYATVVLVHFALQPTDLCQLQQDEAASLLIRA